jgi:predicted nucleic acid-binding protein
VLAESIGLLFRSTDFQRASNYFRGVLEFFALDQNLLVHINSNHFDRAWQLRLKYDDKPDISFVDFTSMVVMQEHGIDTVVTGDRHFEQVNLSFRLVP